jgi:hypothetical protein
MEIELILTESNYYSREADFHYMSCSQYSDFLECEAAEMAKLEGNYTPPQPEAFIHGNYFHTALEGKEEHIAFCEAYADEIYKSRGKSAAAGKGKYAAYEKLDEMIAAVRADEVIAKLLDADGECERIVQGKLFGVPWRGKLDKWIPSMNLIIDYKTVADAHQTFYNAATRIRQSFIEEYAYMRRAAVYAELAYQTFELEEYPRFLIVAVSKQDPPEKLLIDLTDQERWGLELSVLDGEMHRIQQIKQGSIAPRMCGMCAYCRANKPTRVIPYTDLMPMSN